MIIIIIIIIMMISIMIIVSWWLAAFAWHGNGCSSCGLSGSTKRAEHATSAPAEFGGEIRNVSRNRASTQFLLQAQKLHVYGGGTFDAFSSCVHPSFADSDGKD